MPSIEQVERIGGASLLGIPAFDFFVWALDTYARGELLMNLHERLPPVMLNPGVGFLCMCGGLGLLYRSHMKHLASLQRSNRRLVDSRGNEYLADTSPQWLVPVGVVIVIALLATPVLALGFSLAYKG